MAEQTSKSKPVKIIKNAQDIQGVKQFDIIDVEYYHFMENPLFNTDVFFVGSFDVNNEKYFVITEAGRSERYASSAYMSSGLYKANDKIILSTEKTMNGHCPIPEYSKYDNPKNEIKVGSKLEKKIKKHFDILKKEKLKESHN
jgi:hypothetical protein